MYLQSLLVFSLFALVTNCLLCFVDSLLTTEKTTQLLY